MSLNLDPKSQDGLDLAKRAVPDNGELEIGPLMGALYHATGLKDQLPPQLANCLEQPQPRRQDVPEKVTVAESLRPILSQLAGDEVPVKPAKFFSTLVNSDLGGEFLSERGVSDALFEELRRMLSQASEEPGPGSGEAVSGWRGSQERQEAIKALGSFGRMLTATEPPYRGSRFGMEPTLRSLIRTLSQMRSRNAIITGHPGTGKSAVVYELARRLRQGEDAMIPSHLRELDIFELSPAFLRSGASMVGQYDERVKSLIQVLQAYPKIVLFIDEIHSLFQSGMHERGPFSDANEAFKGPLGRGEITCIGCTTLAEYRHYIEPDVALARRFTKIRLDPPTAEATVHILEARRPQMESYFAPLRIPDQILERTVQLTEDYLPSRFQPEKSLRLIDEACAQCVTSDPPLDSVSDEALWLALEDMIGHSVVRTQGVTEADLFEQLHAKILGQDEILRGIARAFVAGFGDWTKRAGPRGVFFLAGPTGVGKTETAVLLSQVLGGGGEALVRVNCNQLQGSGHDSGPAINVLLGPPPGYVGYVRGQGGILSKVRDKPESVVLFDEIEKADPGVAKVLLQILDDGRVEDNDGNLLDFRRAFIVFTSNAGCLYDHNPIGFQPPVADTRGIPEVDIDGLKNELRRLGYGEEFLGRIGHFFGFKGLEPEVIQQVIELRLEKLHGTADVKGYQLTWDPAIIQHLAAVWQPRFGVRHLLTILRNRILEQLSVAEAQGELRQVSKIHLQRMEMSPAETGQELTGLARRERSNDTLVIKIA